MSLYKKGNEQGSAGKAEYRSAADFRCNRSRVIGGALPALVQQNILPCTAKRTRFGCLARQAAIASWIAWVTLAPCA